MKTQLTNRDCFRRLIISPEWAANNTITVHQGIESGNMTNCHIVVAETYINEIKIYDLILALKAAQFQAQTWNKDAGKPAGDVLK